MHFDSESNQKYDTNFRNIIFIKNLDIHLHHTETDITKRKFMVWKN